MEWPAAQVIEAFHLAFLEVLRTRVSHEYVLKGGANLRYFFHSVRYSEDIDFDISSELPGWSLEERIDRLLNGSALTMILRSSGLGIHGDQITKPKQTDTTRRWKVSIEASGHTNPVRTKIEFSARDGETRYATEQVPDHVVKPYGLAPPMVAHYLGEAATEQKVLALAQRSQTQARDVFDLDLLLRKTPLAPGALTRVKREDAAERGAELTYDAFRDQVLRFLDEGIKALYDEPAWERMQRFVISQLLGDDR